MDEGLHFGWCGGMLGFGCGFAWCAWKSCGWVAEWGGLWMGIWCGGGGLKGECKDLFMLSGIQESECIM